MIKIIKHGQKEFTHTCSRCGCEFMYEYEDIKLTPTLTSNFNRAVVCPDCGNICYIDLDNTVPPTIGWPTPGKPIPCNTADPCSTCDWYNKMLKNGEIYIGDTPCTWCDNNKFSVNTLGLNTEAGKSFLQWAADTQHENFKNYITPRVMDTGTNTLGGYQPTTGSSTPPAPPRSGSNAVKGCNSCHNSTKTCGNKSTNKK